jgi:hypothetical protein
MRIFMKLNKIVPRAAGSKETMVLTGPIGGGARIGTR